MSFCTGAVILYSSYYFPYFDGDIITSVLNLIICAFTINCANDKEIYWYLTHENPTMNKHNKHWRLLVEPLK